MTENFDLTPSWKTTAEIYLMVLDNPDASQQSRKDAKEEILRMADLADRYVKLIRGETIDQA